MSYRKSLPTPTRILLFIAKFVRDNGYPPTMREMATGVWVSSTSTVRYHLKKLEEKGLIERQPRKARSVRLIAPESGTDLRSGF